VPVYGDGKQVRDWLFVEDQCEALDLVLQKGEIGEIYNVGANNEEFNMDVTQSILKLLGRGQEFITYVKDRPGHDRRYAVDIEKISKLGWKPRHDFQAGIKKTVEWYVKNDEWWKKIKQKQADYKVWMEKQYGAVSKG
jgi:dTDP-glucose 4,6-dehydratase